MACWPQRAQGDPRIGDVQERHLFAMVILRALRTDASSSSLETSLAARSAARLIDVLINMRSWTEEIQDFEPFYISLDSKVKNYDLSRRKVNPRPLIVKQIYCENEIVRDWALREGEIAMNLHHPNICPTISCGSEAIPGSGFFIYIIMEKLKNNLFDDYEYRMTQRPAKFYTEQELWNILGSLTNAYSYLQKQMIAHRDIKPQNILMDEHGPIKICDFGFSKRMDVDPAKLQTLAGTVPFFSPLLRHALIQGQKDLIRVSHNVWKSDVYSLGVTMLILTILEIPAFITNLKNLEKNIMDKIEEIRTTTSYTEKWLQILIRMLTVEEAARPDFLQLEKEIECPLPYVDDELIEQITVESIPCPLQMEIKSGLSYVRVSPNKSDEVPCLVVLKATELDENLRMYWTDVVCVVDMSGSVEGECMMLTQETLKKLVGKLGDRDRMCIITFSDYAERICPLTACTPDGKSSLCSYIDSFALGDLTNIYAGFSMALQVFSQRRVKNSEAVMMLFTDGQDNCQERSMELCEQAMKENPIEKLQVHCFGFGSSIDTKFLERLADLGHGEFRHVNSFEILQDIDFAFASITSVVARDIFITLSVPSNTSVPFTITKVFSKDGEPSFYLKEIGANSEKDFVFIVKPSFMQVTKTQKQRLVNVHLKYIDNEGLESDTDLQIEAKITNWTDVPPLQDATVFANLYRVKGANCMQEVRHLAEERRFEEAGRRLSECIEYLSASGHDSHPIVSKVLEDLKRLISFAGSDNSWAQGGEAAFVSSFHSHYSQRPSVLTEQYASRR